MLRYIHRHAKYILGVVSLSAIFVLGTSGQVLAAPQDITMSPTSVNQIISPGETVTGNFQVIDQGSTTYKYSIYTTPYRVSGEDYNPEFTALPGAPNVVNWIKLSSAGGSINPGQSITVNYAVTVPANTLPGGYYAVAFAQTQLPKAPVGVTLNERVGQIFYLQVAGPSVQKGAILTWQSSFLQKPPLTSTLRLQNAGSVHYMSNINVVVSDIFGSPKFTVNTVKVVLPQTIRRVSLPWSKTPSFGLFKVSGSVNFLDHTNKLSTKYVLVMSQTVRIYVIGIVVLLVILLILRRLMKRSRKKGHAKPSYKVK